MYWIRRHPPFILKRFLRFRYSGSCTGFVDSSIETVDKPQPELRLQFQYSVFLTTWPAQPCFAASLQRDGCNMMFANTSYFVHDIGSATLIRLRIRCRKWRILPKSTNPVQRDIGANVRVACSHLRPPLLSANSPLRRQRRFGTIPRTAQARPANEKEVSSDAKASRRLASQRKTSRWSPSTFRR
jgi:hypothetical protein